AVASPSSAQQFPNRTVTLVVPFAAGGSTDLVARIVAQKMSDDLGQQVIVENVAGAGGNIGADRVARSDP
ncbi:Bug family tripartite tricarboxylate transporter substrate binding protein, partial [Salmonella enterica]